MRKRRYVLSTPFVGHVQRIQCRMHASHALFFYDDGHLRGRGTERDGQSRRLFAVSDIFPCTEEGMLTVSRNDVTLYTSFGSFQSIWSMECG